jgi:hypothetical protein
MSTYTECGFKNRLDYLKDLSLEFEVPLETVLAMADILGPSEDFDGLVTSLEDASDA